MKLDKKLSKLITVVLRHTPERLGLELDEEGWVSVTALLAGLRHERKEWQEVSVEDLQALIASETKKRYEIKGGRIRALYGHSVEGKISKTPTIPPALLYHGTNLEALETIQSEGLRPMQRQYVHLATDIETARTVALRKTTQPVILQIQTEKAHQHGIRFYREANGVWLADAIPPQFLTILPPE